MPEAQAVGMIFVVPVAGQTVSDPFTGKVVPPEGDMVRDSDFWRRRVADGDFRIGDGPSQGAATAAHSHSPPADAGAESQTRRR